MHTQNTEEFTHTKHNNLRKNTTNTNQAKNTRDTKDSVHSTFYQNDKPDKRSSTLNTNLP